MVDSNTAPDDARCKTCGYSLRGIATTRCPECGREFNPADLGTMHLGQPAGVFGRILLAKPSAIPIALCCIAAIALLAISRYPSSKPQASWVELKYYFHRDIRSRLVVPGDLVFVGAVALVCVSLVYLIARFVARLIASRHYHRPAERPVHLGRRAAMLSLAVAASALAAAFSWPYRISKIWIRMWGDQLKAASASRYPWLTGPPTTTPPIALSNAEIENVLRSAIIQLPTVAERTTALNLLMTGYQRVAPSILLSAIAQEKDSKLRAMEIGLIGLYGDLKYVPELMALMNDPDPTARAAAIDALSIIYWPAYPIPNKMYGGSTEITLATEPPVPLPQSYGYATPWGNPQKEERNTIPDNLLARLKTLAFHGPTTQDREAAARAIFKWQGRPKFRVAEWGVWIAGTNGNFQMLKSVLDEIPPFVHQTGDRVESDPSYLSMPDIIDKPIIHITCDEPFVLDIAVLINGGRPWFVYPLPDDYTVTSGGRDPAFLKTYNPSLAKLPAPHRGYKWISPPHDTDASVDGNGAMTVDSIGVRWQTLLVSPQKLDWMHPPTVPVDERYAWWSRLRQVPSCWVSSRGEAERFIYYDGPTTFPSRWVAVVESDYLRFKYNQQSERYGNYQFESLDANATNVEVERGLYIRVDRANQLTGGWITIADSTYDPAQKVALSVLNSLHGPEVPAKLLRILTDAGLTTDEASGLIDSWRPQFFETVGRRFLRIMLAKEYTTICPIQINPAPTELVRVGIVLNEFGEA